MAVPDSATSSTGEVCSGISTLHESLHGWDEVMLERGMEPADEQLASRRRILVDAGIRAFAFCRMSRGEIAAYRRRPGTLPPGWRGIQASTLRYSDEQTIGAVAALVMAVGQLGCSIPASFQRWGVVAASRFLGRSNLLVAMNRFRAEGVWGVSPHLIPHFALHSPAGTLSLALGIHGPNLGVGGGLWSEFEGIQTALTWLQAGIVPGLWLVFSGWSPEFVPDREGEPMADCECQALAVVLGPPSSAKLDRPCFQLVAGEVLVSPRPLDLTVLAGLLDQSSRDAGRGSRITCDLVAHDGHHDPGIPQPHFAPRTQ